MAIARLALSEPQQARIAARLGQEEYAYLTTVRSDGWPHTVPVCFVWDGSSILIFSRPNTVKCRNLRQTRTSHWRLTAFAPTSSR